MNSDADDDTAVVVEIGCVVDSSPMDLYEVGRTPPLLLLLLTLDEDVEDVLEGYLTDKGSRNSLKFCVRFLVCKGEGVTVRVIVCHLTTQSFSGD